MDTLVCQITCGHARVSNDVDRWADFGSCPSPIASMDDRLMADLGMRTLLLSAGSNEMGVLKPSRPVALT